VPFEALFDRQFIDRPYNCETLGKEKQCLEQVLFGVSPPVEVRTVFVRQADVVDVDIDAIGEPRNHL
jgi:hypothetical protein